jgi:HPt (histidine-containing phosphotransfer) domain-containing protein
MIDWCQVARLRDEVGAEDFEEVVALFMEEVQEIVDKIEASPDPASLESDMHFLKGSALNLGFRDLSARCSEGEKTAARGEPDQVDLSGVLQSYATSKAMFLSELDAHLAA